jgi:hypothetical protein
MVKMMDAKKLGLIEDRIVEMVFESDTQLFINWLRLVTKTADIDDDNIVGYKTFDNRAGGFPFNCDPPTKATMIAFAIGGIFWTRMFPGLLNKVGKSWKKKK